MGPVKPDNNLQRKKIKISRGQKYLAESVIKQLKEEKEKKHFAG